ncbi:hypothetical protein JRQ81_006673 [Phrynocephalus forsythii]|uniref:Bcl-2 Bcl-2 homology region 1-3 domain-containing protein n=1 Tax=Phrynocephalus forsythii TaxID=171643 RepID=A0A9Q1ATY8_9SAUR|nr:hypothetical protein JRQ81_006673 [Phrynocephalus forsythii]
MEHLAFLDVFSLVQDYLKHISRERGRCEAPPSKAAEVLRNVGSSLQKEVGSHLQPCLDSLEIRSVDEASRIFRQVMDEEFADGNTNWGRILTIFVFGGILAEKLQGQGVPLEEKNLEQIAHFIAKYIIRTKAKWISEHGGWEDGFVARFEENKPWLSVHNMKATIASVFSFFSQYY